MRAAVLLLALASAPALAGAPPEVVPVPAADPSKWAEVTAAPGRLLRLSAEPASKWLLVDEDGADLLSCDGGKFGDFCAPLPGRYRLIVTGPDGAASRVVVVVGDAPPGPGPKPPTPPADPLKARLAAAFAADADAEKREHAKDLAELYRQAAKLAADATVATAGDLLARVKAASAAMVGPDALKGVRSEVGRELGTLFPADGPLTDDQRAKAAALFGKLATILDQLGA